MTSPTKEPVTVGGWYENQDGTVSLYRWHDGRLKLDTTVLSWDAVPSNDKRLACPPKEYKR